MTHMMDAIAWTLIHFCWQATAIAAIYRLLNSTLVRSSSHGRYLMALAAMLAMLTAAVVTFGWEIRSAGHPRTLSVTASGIESGIASTGFPQSVAPGVIQTNISDRGNSQAGLLRWIDGLWLLGVICLSLRSLGGWYLMQRLRATYSATVPASILTSCQRISSVFGLRRPVTLRITGAVAGPMTVGILRTMVLLPLSSVTLLSPDELEAVLAHELAHIRRGDFFWNLVQTFVETFFFFHPAVWWIGRRMRDERELCCDDLALKVCPNPVAYASALLQLEEQRARQLSFAMALDGNQSPMSLRMRIERILGEPPARAASRPLTPLSLALACVALLAVVFPAPKVLASLHADHGAPAATIALSQSKLTPKLALVHSGLPELSTPPARPRPMIRAAIPAPQTKPDGSAEPSSNYIDRMRAAGYDVDVDKYIAMKIQGVTPEYASAMSQVGFGKPSADDLVACKIYDVTPEYISQLKQQGLETKNLHDAISYRIFKVTPDFVAGMKAAGFTDISSEQLLALRVQGVTPEYAKQISQQFPGATIEDVVRTRIFHIDADFIALAKKHGFANLTLEKLVQLRISGILDDESVKP
jgi:beta-lactamase regulating signal transducer with metallopeptidase domain